MDRSYRLLHGQPRQPFEWNYFPLLTGRIGLSNTYADKPETIGVLKDIIREDIGKIQLYTIDKLYRSCRLLHGQPRQPFEWKYFPLLTGRIVLSNKKRNLRKYSVVVLKAFSKKKVFGGVCTHFLICCLKGKQFYFANLTLIGKISIRLLGILLF